MTKKTESHLRSILKGVSWRIVGTLDTIILSFFITGKLKVAIKIGITEVVTKVLLYYLHERAWLFFLKGKEQTHAISLAKAITWRIVATLDTMVLGWFYSGNPLMGVKIGLLEIVTKIILYYLHERVWNAVPIGTVRRWFKFFRREC
ncbi:MAG: DUF2061 domain-containing protein [Chitinophagales bacterium]|nr:DUF2061 domain-containing protein [Chitinophagales bacterium]MDW8419154.1 DUF2061 domain-containing protein [Chitinophagales bacterium]